MEPDSRRSKTSSDWTQPASRSPTPPRRDVHILTFRTLQEGLHCNTLAPSRWKSLRTSADQRPGLTRQSASASSSTATLVKYDLPPPQEQDPHVPVPGLPTDVTFPGISDKVPVEVRTSVARLHTNLGHPSAQELTRLLCHQGVPGNGVIECVKKLQCATCQRLSAPQQPRPATMPSLKAGQFGDAVQGDFFWVRLSDGSAYQILGLADTSTGFHQAGVLKNKSARGSYNLLDKLSLRPYGLPVRFLLDPDPLSQGEFNDLLTTTAEAHWIIGTVERRNAVLRTTLERLINDHAAVTVDQLEHLLTPALHASEYF